MSALPRVRQITPLAQVKKSALPLPVTPREKKPSCQTAQRDWQEALQTPNESLRQAFVLPAQPLNPQQDRGDSEQEKNEQDPTNETALSKDKKLRAGAVEAIVQTSEESLPLNMNRLGGLMAAFVVHSVVHGAWAVQIPLAHTLLQDTILHMRCEQGILTLRFETTDWCSRETLMLHAPTLLRKLRQSLPQMVEIVLLTH